MTVYQIGSEHVFERAGVRQTFRRVPDGWSDHRGVLWDDVSLADRGWRYLAPAGQLGTQPSSSSISSSR